MSKPDRSPSLDFSFHDAARQIEIASIRHGMMLGKWWNRRIDNAIGRILSFSCQSFLIGRFVGNSRSSYDFDAFFRLVRRLGGEVSIHNLSDDSDTTVFLGANNSFRTLVDFASVSCDLRGGNLLRTVHKTLEPSLNCHFSINEKMITTLFNGEESSQTFFLALMLLDGVVDRKNPYAAPKSHAIRCSFNQNGNSLVVDICLSGIYSRFYRAGKLDEDIQLQYGAKVSDIVHQLDKVGMEA